MRTHLLLFVSVTSGVLSCSRYPESEIFDQKPNVAITERGEYEYVLAGEGQPTILLEGGLGDTMEVWTTSFDDLSEIAQTFAYNRANYGGSTSQTKTRDGMAAVDELHEILEAEDIPPPYILVGHSLGGLYMQLFARTYSEDVAGVILIDSGKLEYLERCKAAKGKLCTLPPFVRRILSPERADLEFGQFDQLKTQIREAPPFPEVPLAILIGTKSRKTKGTRRSHAVWIETNRELAELSPVSKITECEECGHYLHYDNPTAFIDAVHWVLNNKSDLTAKVSMSPPSH